MGSLKQFEQFAADLADSSLGSEQLLEKYGGETADLAAEALLAKAADAGFDESMERLIHLAQSVYSEKLMTVVAGLLWREDIRWLQGRDSAGVDVRLSLLTFAAGKSPASLSPLFWRAVGEKGTAYLDTAFHAIRNTFPVQAAALLVRLCQAAVDDRYEMDIREKVDAFLDHHDSAVRSAFLDAMRPVPQVQKRKIMTHLDISLMAELGESALEHKGKSFFYDEVGERKKREDKGKDVFAEVARRLERGDKPD